MVLTDSSLELLEIVSRKVSGAELDVKNLQHPVTALNFVSEILWYELSRTEGAGVDEPGKLCVRLRRVRENIRAEVAGELLTADVSAKFEARLGEDRVQDSLVAVPTIVLWIFFYHYNIFFYPPF